MTFLRRYHSLLLYSMFHYVCGERYYRCKRPFSSPTGIDKQYCQTMSIIVTRNSTPCANVSSAYKQNAGTVSKENIVYKTYAGVDYNSPNLIVNSVVSYPPPTTKGKGRSGEDLSYCLLISITTNRKGREGVSADLTSSNWHFMEHGLGQPPTTRLSWH